MKCYIVILQTKTENLFIHEYNNQVFTIFNIIPDYDLSIMKKEKTLFDITTRILDKIKNLFEKIKLDMVLVMRDTIERLEGVNAGTLRLVGTKEETIYKNFKELLENKEEYNKMAQACNPYGDGKSSKEILKQASPKTMHINYFMFHKMDLEMTIEDLKEMERQKKVRKDL